MPDTRQTIQRKLVLDAVRSMKDHPTADEIYVSISKVYPSISRATVYRNLHLLTDNGEIRKVELLNSPDRYDYRLPHHYHFRCRLCGMVLDVNIEYLDWINALTEEANGFLAEDHEVIFKGTCANCTQKSERKV